MTNIILRVLKISPAIVMVLLAGAALEASEPTGITPAGDLDEATAMKTAAVSRYTPMEIYGVQVFIDSKTGLMRTPTPEEAAALSAELRSRFGGLAPQTKTQAVPVVHENGAVSMELEPGLFNFSVVRIQPDGEAQFECTKGHDHALELVEGVRAEQEKE
ncbi:MAG: hypothetical protein P8Y44_12760 [Acidobacteriota bacterium]